MSRTTTSCRARSPAAGTATRPPTSGWSAGSSGPTSKHCSRAVTRELGHGSATWTKRPAYDLTLSASKSVSLLWGLGDREVASTVEAAHDRAVEAAFAYLNENACVVRRGHGGTTRLDGGGLIAAVFRHRTSRELDPNLHSHVLVANMTRGADDKWSCPFGTLLFRHARAAGCIYQSVLRRQLSNDSASASARSPRATPTSLASIGRHAPGVQQATHCDRAADGRARHQVPTRRRDRRPRHPAEQGRTVHRGRTPPVWSVEAAEIGLDVASSLGKPGPGRRRRWLGHRPGPGPDREGRDLRTQPDRRGRRLVVTHRPAARGDRGTDRRVHRQRLLPALADRSLHDPGDAGDRDGGGRLRHHQPSPGLGDPRRGRRGDAGTAVAERRTAPGGRLDHRQRPGQLCRRTCRGRQDLRSRRRPSRMAGQRTRPHRLLARRPSGPTARDQLGHRVRYRRQAPRRPRRAAAAGSTNAASSWSTRPACWAAGARGGSCAMSDEATPSSSWSATPSSSPRSMPADCSPCSPTASAAPSSPRTAASDSPPNERPRPGSVTARSTEALLRLSRAGRVTTNRNAHELRSRMVDDWHRETRDGTDAVMLALHRSDVADLNRRARARRLAAGELGETVLEIGNDQFAIGDRVMTLRNNRRLGVLNGTLGTVIGADGHDLVIDTDDGERRTFRVHYVVDGHADPRLRLHHPQGPGPHRRRRPAPRRRHPLRRSRLHRHHPRPRTEPPLRRRSPRRRRHQVRSSGPSNAAPPSRPPSSSWDLGCEHRRRAPCPGAPPSRSTAREIRTRRGLTPSITSPDILGKVLVLMRTRSTVLRRPSEGRLIGAVALTPSFGRSDRSDCARSTPRPTQQRPGVRARVSGQPSPRGR